MKTRRIALLPFVLAAGMWASAAPPAGAQAGLRLICSNVIKSAVERLLPDYERQSGRHVTVDWGASAELKRAIDAGAAFDVALLTTNVIGALVQEGKVAESSRRDIAQANLAVVIRQGTPKSDVGTADGMRRRLQAARSITYSKDGGGVAAIERMLKGLGIAAEVQPKIVLQTIAGRAAESVGLGEHELAFAPVTEVVGVKGAEVLGLFPPEFQSPLAVTVGIRANMATAEAAGDFVRFLTTPASLKVIEASGMELLTGK